MSIELALAARDGSIARHCLFIHRVLNEDRVTAVVMARSLEGESLSEEQMRYVVEHWNPEPPSGEDTDG